MCDCEPTYRASGRDPDRLSRRAFVGTTAAAIGTMAVGVGALSGHLAAGAPATIAGPATGDPTPGASPTFGGLQVLRRDEWGGDLPPRGPLYPEDSRFILLHHTASPNNGRAPRELVRISHAYHTGPKGWPDVAYNFMVGYDGSVWETRSGSLAGPIVADASGGSQGYAQLICMIGDFARVPPPPAMQDSVVELIAFLAHRDSIDLGAGATTSFTSRGSDRFPAGTPMTVRTVAGHRDCTLTTCPGDVGYSLIPGWRERARRLLLETSPFDRAARLGAPARRP